MDPIGLGVSQQTPQFRQQMPPSRPLMSNINASIARVAPGNPRLSSKPRQRPQELMTATPGSASSWGYPQSGLSVNTSTSDTTDSSRPSSTNPYTQAPLQAFDRSGTNPWQTASLDPSDFPALGSGSSIQAHGHPPTAQSYASTAGTGALQQPRLQQQQPQSQQPLGSFARQSGTLF
jgi:hypothetical protein